MLESQGKSSLGTVLVRAMQSLSESDKGADIRVAPAIAEDDVCMHHLCEAVSDADIQMAMTIAVGHLRNVPGEYAATTTCDNDSHDYGDKGGIVTACSDARRETVPFFRALVVRGVSGPWVP